MNFAAVILAAGKGTRMNEGSASPIPKVMFEANGKPLLYYAIKNVQDSGIERIVAVVGYKQELVREYFADSIDYAVQEEQLGTGHAAMMARESLIGQVEAVVVCYGDMPLFKPETIKNLIQEYQNEQPTIAMLSVDFADPNFWAFGRILRDEDGYVSEIVEQKDCTEEQKQISESNPGFYIFDAEWLWQNFDKLSTNNAQKEYYLTDLIKIAKDQGKKIIAVKVSSEEEVLGVNNPEQLKEAESILSSRS